MNAKYTLPELVLKVNNELSGDFKSNDSRLKQHLTERRVRDYLTKGLMDKPIKEGRQNIFTEKHLEQLIDIRQKSLLGFSDNVLKSYYSEDSNINAVSDKKSILDDIEKRSFISTRSVFGATVPKPIKKTEAMEYELTENSVLKISGDIKNIDWTELELKFKQLKNEVTK